MNTLITGKSSYVGENLKKWLLKTPDSFAVDEMTMLDQKWRDSDFSKYDVIIHVAAIVHREENEVDDKLYNTVNRDLPVAVAMKAKQEGVKQFVFISTMAVYGYKASVCEKIIIDADTPCKPINAYGKSKLEAEKRLRELNNNNFKVVIIRPPNIYGRNCPGNYCSIFYKIAKLTFVFPLAYEKCVRSMIYIDNLCEIIRLLILYRRSGIFCPQDNRAISTVEIIRIISNAIGKKQYFSRCLGWILSFLGSQFGLVHKAFGDLAYAEELSKLNIGDYRVCSIEDGLRATFKDE